MKNKKSKQELENIALNVREHIIEMATDGGCFIGASLSCADLLVYLYSNLLNVNKNNLRDNNRDYFFLSKGHDVQCPTRDNKDGWTLNEAISSER